LNQERVKVSADLAFWSRLSVAIAQAADFDTALDQALAYCAERTGARLCFLAAFHPAYRVVEHVKLLIAPDSSFAGLDLNPWFRQCPVDTLSFGVALSEGQMMDTGPVWPADDYARYPHLQKLIQAGIRRQITYPFHLTDHHFALILDFESPTIPEETHGLILEFITRLTPLLLGRQREDALARANRALRIIHTSTEAFAHAVTAEALFEAACQLAVKTGYDASWIGLAQHDEERSIFPAASAGLGTAYVANLRVSWGDQPYGRGPTGTAIRERRIVRLHNIASAPDFEPWRDKALTSGFCSSISLPFGLNEDHAIGAFTLYSSNPLAFGEEEQTLLLELTANLTKALQTITARQERDRAISARSSSEERIERLLAASGVVLFELTLRENAAFPLVVSPNIRDMLGYAPDETCRANWWRNHVHPEDLPQAAGAIEHVLQAGQFTHRYRLRHRDGSYRWIRSDLTLQQNVHGTPVGIVGVWIDITERHTAEEKIYQLAHLDPLTELPNRRLLNKRIGDALAEARRTGAHGALLFIDLNRFKTINDMFGHSMGDAALREVAERLKQVLRTTDTVARVGGDEFVVLFTGAGGTPMEAAAHASMGARKIVDALASRPISIGDHEHYLGASIGFTVFPKPDDTLETLIREADTAMYQAKANDANVVMFQQAMHLAIVARHAVEDEVRNALNTDRFEIWLQDQVDSSGTPVSSEVLIRLRSRDGLMVQPTEFIGIAEASGLIVPLGRWILREACALLARVHRARPDWRLSVNVSPRQFSHSSFVSDVTAALEHSGVAPDRLTLEITENLLIKDVSEVTKIMRSLAVGGVRFSVDDFGTGYSSLSYLRQLPIHEIKIDKRFISEVPGDASAVAIVEAILAMSQRLELDVVAEGVETLDQAAFLTARGCSRMQGYYFARPVPVADKPFSPFPK
jgi:diguanylate cyclase (GGDEF)-like protein/PAS domain S-box-containing protein